MSPSRRSMGWGLALAATLAATVWALADDPAETDLAGPRAASAVTAAAAVPATASPRATTGGAATPADPTKVQPVALGLLPRDSPPARRRDLFAAYGNAVPAPALPVAPEAAASQPQAASLPYGFGGRLVTAEGAAVLLNDSSQTHVLAIGATLGDFRLEQDTGAQLEFVHLPSGEHLLLPAGP